VDNQKTISKEVVLSGIGLHTGCMTKMVLKPAPLNYGIRFVRIDLPENPIIPAVHTNVLGVVRGTTIGLNNNTTVYTVEHLLSALYGLGIDNLEIRVDNNEPPVFDGSSKTFVEQILSAGIVEQKQERIYFILKEPVRYEQEGTEIIAYPADDLKITCEITYDHPLISRQEITMSINPENFINEISSARTFCFDYEIESLKKKGLAKGGGLHNSIVIGMDRVHNKEKMRFENEFVRHKLLDLLGDLYLLGRPLKAHITAKRSGHRHNINFVKKLSRLTKNRQLEIEEIKDNIPHRDPMLMIDRVLIVEELKSAIGYKHMTGKEDFFKGHFPGNPIVPGVLIVEALAQTACVLVLARPDLGGKFPYFLSIQNVKFRKPVYPGSILELRINVVHARERAGKVESKAYVDGEVVTECDFGYIVVDGQKR